MNICLVAGARPNFIKLAPIIHAAEKAAKEGKDISFTLVYTGRKGDSTLEDSLFADLRIDEPQVYLGVDCENLNELTGHVMSAFDDYLSESKNDVVIVVDDLASTMAAAIVTKKKGILLAHLVAGTRSFDINMPKEINRLVIDGLSDLLFTAGISNNSIVNKEGGNLSKVYMVGNILMDTLRENYNRLKRPAELSELGIEDGGYIVFTINRKVLLANEMELESLLRAMISNAGETPIVAVLRPRAEEAVNKALKAISKEGFIKMLHPMSYLEFGYLTAHAQGIITDSGNVAEEATFNGVACITLNSYTEHIETVKEGSNVLVGEDADVLAEYVKQMAAGEWKKSNVPDRWDGRSAERIISILLG